MDEKIESFLTAAKLIGWEITTKKHFEHTRITLEKKEVRIKIWVDYFLGKFTDFSAEYSEHKGVFHSIMEDNLEIGINKIMQWI
ncbi:hypothetical protein D3C71_1301970 [compost metagenome]